MSVSRRPRSMAVKGYLVRERAMPVHRLYHLAGPVVHVHGTLTNVTGFTILDNVVCVNGTMFVVANDWEKVPKLGDIASSSLDPSRPPRVQDWHILTASDASEWFGPYAAK